MRMISTVFCVLGMATVTPISFGQAVAPPKGKLVKPISIDVQKPAPLPTLGAYVRDRVSVADPSAEISARSILKRQNPARLNPVPFAPANLPDPFEHAEAVRLRTPWPESPEPPLFVVPPTKR
jgi:hypothetical protein